jgi:predicted MFS family arabinose efflux permease
MLGVYAIVETTKYGWTSAHTLGFGAGAIALAVAFLVTESRVRNPMLPLRVFRLRGLMGSSVVRGLTASGMFTTFFLGSLYLEHVRHFDALQIGLSFLPMTLVVAIFSSGPTARLVNRFGPKRVLVPGLTAMAASLAVLSTVNADTAFFPTIFVAFALMGVGGGTSFMPLLHIAMGDVEARDAGLASGIVNVSMWIAASLGLAALGAIATDRASTLLQHGHSAATALTGGYDLAFLIGAGLVVAAVIVAIVVLPPGERETEAEPEAEAEPALTG